MRFPSIFLTGTDTDIGKTVISAAILSAAQRRGLHINYWKPLQTGGSRLDRNRIAELVVDHEFAKLKEWSYPLPAAPDQAAEQVGESGPLVEQIREVMANAQDTPLLIEGAGGLLVPLNTQGETWREFVDRSHLPVVLVARSGLGTINHTLLSLEALDAAGIDVLAVILNGPKHDANFASLRRLRPDHRFTAMPWLDSLGQGESWREASDDLLDFLLAAPELENDIRWPDADRQHCWHPYTQHLNAPIPVAISSASGIYLHTETGETLIDASASWWTNSTGHAHPRIGAAISLQQRRLDHCIFAGATHKPASLLAERLCDLSEGHLTRVFYSDNGSCAVEVALKMVAQSWQNKGQNAKKLFLYFHGAYHGDTFGAMSVGATESFHKAFAPYLFNGKTLVPVTAHASRLCPEGPLTLASGIEAMNCLFEAYADSLAGVIIEPWVQAASGMNIQDLNWLRHLGQSCKKYALPLILDEVFTGMGRLGSMYAFQRAGLQPDVVCIAKGLTGGTLPLAATLTRENLFESFLSEDRSKALLHGHTFTGNAIACAAALATLRVYRDERLIERTGQTEQLLGQWLSEHSEQFGLINPRCLGAMMAFELPGSGAGDYFHPLAQKVPVVARRHGLLMRTLGNTMYLVPPLSIQAAELRDTLFRIERTLIDLHEVTSH